MRCFLASFLIFTACGTENSSNKDSEYCWDASPIYYVNEDRAECKMFHYSFCGTQSEYNAYRQKTDEEIAQARSVGFRKVLDEDDHAQCTK